MNIKRLAKTALFRPGYRKQRVLGGALRGMYFHFDLRVDTQEWRGIYEQALQRWLRMYVCPGSVCLDIGSANGYFALLMAKLAGPSGQVFAFEPSSINQFIGRNFGLNANQNLAPLGLRDDFVVGPGCAGDHKIAIDDFVAAEHIPRIDVVKIDVDGGEVDALEGMAETLTRFHPHLFVEVHSRELLAQVERITRCHGYEMCLEHPPVHELRPLEFNSFYFSEIRS